MRVLVIGAGVSGSAAARLARRLGHRVTLYDRDTATAAAVLAAGFPAWSGEWSRDFLSGVDLAVVSPGLAEHSRPVRDCLEEGVPLVGEIEFAYPHVDGKLVAVTGTNGKTTVTSLATAMLRESGAKAVAAGNIGMPLSDVVGDRWDAIVVEASSFQLRFTQSFHPAVAVLLNIAPDHLDWHVTMAAYTAAKANILRNQGSDDLVVYDVDDPGARKVVGGARARRVPVSGHHRPEGGAGPVGDILEFGPSAVAIGDLAGEDPAFLVDVAAAGAAALGAGAAPAALVKAARSYRPGPHRRTQVGTWSGVSWVDDSKATNPHAAEAAARAYPSVVLIAGGRNKGLDLSSLTTVPSVRAVVAIGEAGLELAEIEGAAVTLASSMADAVDIAAGLAVPGDTVLLAPGCASFDMFDSYAHRGDVFAAEVRRRYEEH